MLMVIVHWHRIVIQIQIYFIRSEYRQQDESKEIERIVYCHHYYPYSGSTKFSQFKLKILLELFADFLHRYVMLGTNRKTSTNKWQVPFLVQTVLRIKYYAISITHFQPLGIRILQTCPFHVCQFFLAAVE